MTRKDTKKKIDIRIMRLNKWYVPKSVDLHDCENHVILGYFDELQVKEATGEDVSREKLNPFTAGYRSLISWKSDYKEKTVDCSSQEQILFLNVSEDEEGGINFAEKTVQDFWEKEESGVYPYLFLSMIHISHSGKLAKALQKIKQAFKKDYLSYISYDYCDIVLFAQNLTIPEFMNCIKKLFEVDNGQEKVIFDTFSMVSFHPRYDLNQCKKTGDLIEDSRKKFQATINLSIRDHRAFDDWYQKEITDQGITVEYYDLFGRHDISITKENADTEWLMQIMKKLHDKENHKKFWTFETFIKIKKEPPINVDSDTADELEEIHEEVKGRLQREIEKLKVAIDRTQILDKYRFILPVCEVRDCICSIVKNSFAEEFVCCIYESFLHFVSYMTTEFGKIGDKPDKYRYQEDKIAQVYDKYFVALNTLVNSTMHNERQFVQATAFNAVFYSVPPKIMAFYNAYIYRMKKILMDRNSKEYTFLIYPSFSPIISIEQISLDVPPPCDRILTITISESALYDIESVMYQMVHELTHYVGRSLRCRGIRKNKIISTLLRWIADECRMDDETYRILQYLVEDENKDSETENSHAQYLYLEYLPKMGVDLLGILENWEFTYDLFKAYCEKPAEELSLGEEPDFEDRILEEYGIEKKQQKTYIENYTEQYASVKSNEFHKKLMKMDSFDKAKRYKSYMDMIQYVYRECHADLQMILVLGMSAEDYLNTFLVNLKIPVRDLLSQPKDMIRISTIFRTLINCGLWKVHKDAKNENFMTVYRFIDDYNKTVEKDTDKDRIAISGQKAKTLKDKASRLSFENGIRLKGHLTGNIAYDLEKESPDIIPFTAVAAGLYEYLLEVMDVSLKEYTNSDKAEQIRQARKLIGKIINFNDATEVFNCVEEELNSYKYEGCQIKTPGSKNIQ